MRNGDEIRMAPMIGWAILPLAFLLMIPGPSSPDRDPIPSDLTLHVIAPARRPPPALFKTQRRIIASPAVKEEINASPAIHIVDLPLSPEAPVDAAWVGAREIVATGPTVEDARTAFNSRMEKIQSVCESKAGRRLVSLSQSQIAWQDAISPDVNYIVRQTFECR